MSKLNVVRRCYSCGVILQGEDPEQPGYVDKALLDSSPSNILFCEKCWSEQRYNIAPRKAVASPEFITMLKDAQASDALIVYVVDLFSFEASFIDEVSKTISGLKILVIANKRDLLPSKVDDEALRVYTAHRFRVAALGVQKEDVYLMSTLSSQSDIEEIVNEMQRRRQGHDVYVIGAVGAGKSRFLASFLRDFQNSSSHPIQWANYPGTKLRVMQIPLDTSSMIYDTPGTSVENSITGKLTLEEANATRPQERVNARAHTLMPGESIIIGGLARIDLIEGKKNGTPIKCYFAPGVTLKKARGNLDAAFLKAIESKSVRPTSAALKALVDFDVFDLDVEEVGSRDIGIEGLGWINFEGKKQKFRIYLPKGVSLYTSRAKII
ncbi:MAG: hypothetical protein J5736_03235 [Bacilli bacterium]|nr:hypothetical protein [Bacilli bacterium]